MTPPLTDTELLAYIERTPELRAALIAARLYANQLFEEPYIPPDTRRIARAFHAHEQRVREELTRQLFSEAAHIAENAGSLAKIPGMTDEARCRELCAVYLKEAATYFRDTGRLDFASTAPQLSTAAVSTAPSPEGAGQGEAAEAVGLPKLCPACGADTAFVSAFARTLVYRKTLLTIPDMEQTACDSCAYTYQTHGQHDRNIEKIKAAFLTKQGGKP